MTQAGEVGQLNSPSLLRRKVAHRVANDAGAASIDAGALGSGTTILEFEDIVEVLFEVGTARFARPQPIDGASPNNRQEPGGNGAANGIVAFSGPPELQVCLETDVFSGRRIPDDAQTKAIHHPTGDVV
jgi:hypothetical protein